jgi:hypothetical protein
VGWLRSVGCSAGALLLRELQRVGLYPRRCRRCNRPLREPQLLADLLSNPVLTVVLLSALSSSHSVFRHAQAVAKGAVFAFANTECRNRLEGSVASGAMGSDTAEIIAGTFALVVCKLRASSVDNCDAREREG